jgi:hypothetical protein
MKIYEYIYTYFLNTSLTNYESEISNLDWTNKDLFQFKKWLVNSTNAFPPNVLDNYRIIYDNNGNLIEPDNYKYTGFFKNINPLEFTNTDLFYLKKWLSGNKTLNLEMRNYNLFNLSDKYQLSDSKSDDNNLKDNLLGYVNYLNENNIVPLSLENINLMDTLELNKMEAVFNTLFPDFLYRLNEYREEIINMYDDTRSNDELTNAELHRKYVYQVSHIPVNECIIILQKENNIYEYLYTVNYDKDSEKPIKYELIKKELMAEDKTLEDYINENKKNNNLAQYYSYYSFNNYQNGFKNTFGFGRNDLEFYLGNYTETINLINYKLNEELNSDGLTLFQILGIDVDTLETNVITLYAYFGILIDLIDNDAPGIFQGVYSNTIGSLLDSDALENEVYIINLERYRENYSNITDVLNAITNFYTLIGINLFQPLYDIWSQLTVSFTELLAVLPITGLVLIEIEAGDDTGEWANIEQTIINDTLLYFDQVEELPLYNSRFYILSQLKDLVDEENKYCIKNNEESVIINFELEKLYEINQCGKNNQSLIMISGENNIFSLNNYTKSDSVIYTGNVVDFISYSELETITQDGYTYQYPGEIPYLLELATLDKTNSSGKLSNDDNNKVSILKFSQNLDINKGATEFRISSDGNIYVRGVRSYYIYPDKDDDGNINYNTYYVFYVLLNIISIKKSDKNLFNEFSISYDLDFMKRNNYTILYTENGIQQTIDTSSDDYENANNIIKDLLIEKLTNSGDKQFISELYNDYTYSIPYYVDKPNNQNSYIKLNYYNNNRKDQFTIDLSYGDIKIYPVSNNEVNVLVLYENLFVNLSNGGFKLGFSGQGETIEAGQANGIDIKLQNVNEDDNIGHKLVAPDNIEFYGLDGINENFKKEEPTVDKPENTDALTRLTTVNDMSYNSNQGTVVNTRTDISQIKQLPKHESFYGYDYLQTGSNEYLAVKHIIAYSQDLINKLNFSGESTIDERLDINAPLDLIKSIGLTYLEENNELLFIFIRFDEGYAIFVKEVVNDNYKLDYNGFVNTVFIVGENSDGNTFVLDAIKDNVIEAPSKIIGTWKFNSDTDGTGELQGLTYGVGPEEFNRDWFKMTANEMGNIPIRAVQINDNIIFNEDNTYQYNFGNDETLFEYNGFSEAGTPPAPQDGSSTYSWNLFITKDSTVLRLGGTGAWLGLHKVYNGGELSSPTDSLPSSINYKIYDQITSTSNDVSKEKMVLTIESIFLDANSSVNWTFVYERV